MNLPAFPASAASRSALSRFFRCLLVTLAVVWAGLLSPGAARGQKTPVIQGTSVPDAAVPTVITAPSFLSNYTALNQDLSVQTHALTDSSQNKMCPAPAGYQASSPTPRTVQNDFYTAYVTAQGTDANVALSAVQPQNNCMQTPAFEIAGGTPLQSLASNDIFSGRYYLVSAFGGNGPDTLTVINNLNNATVSGNNAFTQQGSFNLDTGGYYTSVVTDLKSGFGMTAITELSTGSTTGNLWIYNPGQGQVYKILGPGGVPLPAVTSFIIPASTDGGGELLVLVNQDGLTSDNLGNPPQDTTPITIIDLGQLLPIFNSFISNNTITLPFLTQIKATASYYAMLGGVYNPLDGRVYVAVGGGTSASNVVENVISYDLSNPDTPGETVVADISNINFQFEGFAQLAMNAAAGTMQILVGNPPGVQVYTVGINGMGNTATLLTGAPFGDTGFQPTYVAANALLGETYIASASGQVDVLTRPAASSMGMTLTLNGLDTGFTSQPYTLKVTATFPVYDQSLRTTPLTITATPAGGTPYTFASGHVSDYGFPGGGVYDQMFPAVGEYTLVASAPASANYPAVTSPPLHVFVGNTGVYPTVTTLTVPATSTNGVLNAMVNVAGTTYAPTGQVYVQDQTGAEVGNVQLPGGPIALPISVPVTLSTGTETLTATYSGDEQNQASTSGTQTVVVGTVVQVTPTIGLALASGSVASGATLAGTVTTTSTSATAPTGTIMIYATLAGSTTANQVAMVQAGASFASGGAGFSFTAPAAGSYTLFAGYGGDTNYKYAVSASVALTVTGAALVKTGVGIVAPATATPGAMFAVNLGLDAFGTASAVPTGNIVLTQSSAGAATTTLATITAAQGTEPGGDAVNVSLANAGTYTLTATYSGDTNYATSNNTATVTVTGVATALAVGAAANPVAGQAFNLTATLTATGSTAVPPGNVVVTLTPNNGTTPVVSTFSAAKAFASGGFTFPETLFQSGGYAISAVYGGGGAYSGSMASGTLTVASATTGLTLTGPSSGTAGAGVSYVATLTGGAAPTGNVAITSTMQSGGAGPSATITAAQAAATGGSTVSLTFSAAGVYTVQAAYVGDSNNQAAMSQGLAVTVTGVVTPPSYTFTGNTAGGINLLGDTTIAPLKNLGVTGSLPTILTAMGGYATPVTFSFAADPDSTDGDPKADQAFMELIDVTPEDSSGNVLTSATPMAPGATVNFVFSYKQGLLLASTKQAPHTSIYVAGGLLSFLLLGWRRRGRRLARLVCMLGGLACLGSTMTGCGANDHAQPATVPVVITATPVAGQGTAQKVTVNVTFYEFKSIADVI